MASSTFLAKLIGPIALVVAIGLFTRRAAYRALAHEFMRSAALLYISGLLTLIAGLAIVLNHNVWALRWPVVVTIIGWLMTVGGAARILLPEHVKRFGDAMLDKPLAMTIAGAIWLVIGALLCFFGYLR